MSVLPIHITGSPVLHQKTTRVHEVTDDIRQLVADMVETMHEAPGVGLAAPQVGAGLQVFVWHYDDSEGLSEGHVLNPSLRLSGRRHHRWYGTPDEEGCLSIPGERAPLARFERATLTGVDLDGAPVVVKATGWLARIFQHEFDHLQGLLYRDRVSRRERRVIDATVALNGWGVPGNMWTPGPDHHEGDFVADDLGHPAEEA
jgi:peptide deformylase